MGKQDANWFGAGRVPIGSRALENDRGGERAAKPQFAASPVSIIKVELSTSLAENFLGPGHPASCNQNR